MVKGINRCKIVICFCPPSHTINDFFHSKSVSYQIFTVHSFWSLLDVFLEFLSFSLMFIRCRPHFQHLENNLFVLPLPSKDVKLLFLIFSTSSRERDCSSVLFHVSESPLQSLEWRVAAKWGVQLIMLSLLKFKTWCIIAFIVVGSVLKINEQSNSFLLFHLFIDLYRKKIIGEDLLSVKFYDLKMIHSK